MTTTPVRSAVTPDRIAAEALALLDEGPDETALSMRSLAARLGVQAPSLYAHVSGMDEIHDLVHARINAAIDVSVVDHSLALEDLAELGRRYRSAYRAHRVAASMIVSRSINRDHALRIYEPIAAFLLRYGVPAPLVMPLMALFDNLILGSAVEPFSAAFTGSDQDYALRYPGLATALAGVDREGIDDAAFECGLAAFLDVVSTAATTER